MYVFFCFLLEGIDRLPFLILRECPLVDDWVLDRLTAYRDMLHYLDISGCPLVTERGLGTLHRLR